MKKRYTKRQICEAIAYWEKILESTDSDSSIIAEKYEIADAYFEKPGTYLYIASNPSFVNGIVKIGYSDGETLKKHLTRYSTAVPSQYMPIAQIFFDDNDINIKALEKQLMQNFTQYDGNGGIEFFKSSIANAKAKAKEFAAKYNAQYHPYNLSYKS